MFTPEQIVSILEVIYEIIKIIFEFLVTVEQIDDGTYYVNETTTVQEETTV